MTTNNNNNNNEVVQVPAHVESELEIVARRLRENGDDFSCFQMQMNPGYEARDVDLLTQAILANHTLQKVDFFGILSEDDVNESVKRLVESLGSLPQLKTLKLSGYCMDLLATLGRSVLPRVATSLQQLTIQYVQLQGDFDAFNEALRQCAAGSNLTSFQIIDCQLPEPLRSNNHDGSSVLDTILDSLIVNKQQQQQQQQQSLNSPLKELVLSPINSVALGNIPVQALTRICRHLPHLERLRLYGFQKMGDDSPEVTPILQALQVHPSIEDLRISATLEKDIWTCLAQLLQRTQSLRCLQIDFFPAASRNQHQQLLLLELAKMLPGNSTLEEMRLVPGGGVLFSLDVLESFGKHLETNYTLVLMEPDTPISAMYTKLNRQGRGELIQNQHSNRDDWIDKLIQVRHDLDSVYYYLSMNPLLCDDNTAMEPTTN